MKRGDKVTLLHVGGKTQNVLVVESEERPEKARLILAIQEDEEFMVALVSGPFNGAWFIESAEDFDKLGWAVSSFYYGEMSAVEV